jgi:hypothetical protein
MDERGGIPGRILAPAALVVGAVLFLFVLLSSLGGEEGGRSDRAGETQTQTGQPSRRRGRSSRGARGGAYTVKAGDTLGSIAQKTGISVEQLQERNPQLDPQALVAGQKLRLRE